MMSRSLLSIVVIVVGAICSPAGRAVAAEPAKPTVKTYVYKTVGDLQIKADLHRPATDKVLPVVVWIHGGALIMGHRESVNRRVRRELLASQIAILSIDYRLAPETKLPDIIKDVEDAFAWLRSNGKMLRVDADRVAVMGGSAGGYLTLTAGYRVKPRPKALVSFWGYGDLVGDWYSKPSPHKRHNPRKFSKKEALAQIPGSPVSDSRKRKGNGGVFYLHCRQNGTWPSAVSGGWDPHREAKKFYPYMPVKNVDEQYPETILIHGTKDTDVPYIQSTMMAEQFKKKGVKHRLITVKGGEHGLGGGDRQVINAAYRDAIEFVKSRLSK